MFTFDAETIVQELASAVAEKVAWNTEFHGIHDSVASEIDYTLSYTLNQLSKTELQDETTVVAEITRALINYEIDETVLTSCYTHDLQKYWENNQNLVDDAIFELGGLDALGAQTVSDVIGQGVWAAAGMDARRAIDATLDEIDEIVERVLEN